MVGPRIVETNEGIQNEAAVRMFDEAKRIMRDRGWLETGEILGAGIVKGAILEIGSGPDYVGLEWLKKTEGTGLTGLEISSNMIKIAEKNAVEYGLESRVKYITGDAHKLPFNDGEFDGAFSCESLHEWEEPILVINEIYRVLKPGGEFFVSDLRRDMNPLIKYFMRMFVKSRDMKEGLFSSINAAYTKREIEDILMKTDVKDYKVCTNTIGLCITGQK